MGRGPVASTPPGELSAAVAALCDDALRAASEPDLRRALTEIRAKLSEPLRVAIAGSVSSGKSTLVNALLGQAVAPVDASDCTKVVTWFRYGFPERVDAIGADGAVTTLPLVAGEPLVSGVDHLDGVTSLVVWLSNERLSRMTLIDTPGLDSVDPQRERATRELLALDADSRAAVASADALVLLMPHARRLDGELLKRFAAVTAGAQMSAVNAVGVLSKADRLVAADDNPWPVAVAAARRAAADLALSVSRVVPVAGLLAATALTGALTEADARALAQLAADGLDDGLISHSELMEMDSTVPTWQRRSLLERLDLYGIRVAASVAELGATTVIATLRDVSGFVALDAILTDTFARRSDALKAHMATAALERLSYRATDPEDARLLRLLRDPLDRLAAAPSLHELRLLDAVRGAADGQLDLPPELVADIERLAQHESAHGRLALTATADRDDTRAAAAAAAARWARWGNDSRRSGRERSVARDLRTAYEWIWHGA